MGPIPSCGVTAEYAVSLRDEQVRAVVREGRRGETAMKKLLLVREYKEKRGCDEYNSCKLLNYKYFYNANTCLTKKINMEPTFTLQYPEFLVCNRLQKLCRKDEGFSLYIPLSRQEKGVDMALLHRTEKINRTITIQVKSSRTYLGVPAKRKTTVRYKNYSWFNCFEPSPNADFFALTVVYPTDVNQSKNINSSWYSDCTLLFTYSEMKELMDNCKTTKGKPDSFFGFGFNDLKQIIYLRGDMNRENKDYSSFLINNKIKELKQY